jgi:hypothetical protein
MNENLLGCYVEIFSNLYFLTKLTQLQDLSTAFSMLSLSVMK